MNGKTSITFIYQNLLAPTASLLQNLTVMQQCLFNVQWCLWTQEATGNAWIGLTQNIIDTLLSTNTEGISMLYGPAF